MLSRTDDGKMRVDTTPINLSDNPGGLPRGYSIVEKMEVDKIHDKNGVLDKMVLDTLINRGRAKDIQDLLYPIVQEVSDSFRKESDIYGPDFLFQFFGSNVVRSTFITYWGDIDIKFFFVGDPKTPTYQLLLTASQKKLRYAMLKEFQKRATAAIQDFGYLNCYLYINASVLWVGNKNDKKQVLEDEGEEDDRRGGGRPPPLKKKRV